MENTTLETGPYCVCFGCRSLTPEVAFVGNYCPECHKSQAATALQRLEIALDAAEMLMNQIRECDEKSLGSLKMAAFMLREEWLKPTKKSLHL